MGLNIMCVPEEAGCLGLDSVTQTFIVEQMGRYEVGLGSAVGANASATHLINHVADDKQKEIFYGDELIINGSKCFITNGGIASVYVVMATADRALGRKDIGCYLVERKREGVKIGKEKNILK